VKEEKINFTVARKISRELGEEIRESYEIDCIVALSRGGLVPARYIASELDVDFIYTLGIKFYSDVNNNFKVPFVYQGLTNMFRKGDFVLIVDDIVDSGESIKLAMQEAFKHGAKDVITCSLHYKSKSAYKPDFYGHKVPNDTWIKYDWEK